MASLREIKDRIGSVRSTLKITSAMKLVSSAKLRKAQKAIEGMRPYQQALKEILEAAGAGIQSGAAESPDAGVAADGKVAVVAISSNSSLCGGFNTSIIGRALRTVSAQESPVEVFAIGRKMADAMRKAGYTREDDYNEIIAHPSYKLSAQFARSLAERFESGEFSRVLLVYNRFVSATSQEPVTEQFLPDKPLQPSGSADDGFRKYIIEPSADGLASRLLPQVRNLRFHAAVLDSAAAEQAARTIAMQTATDNAEDLLAELSLEYNKGRQQKITAEILDLVGGQQKQ